MVSQGVSARQARAQGLTPWSGSLVAPALPCCYHCVLDLVSGLCWATSPELVSGSWKTLLCAGSEISSFLLTKSFHLATLIVSHSTQKYFLQLLSSFLLRLFFIGL